MKKRVKKTTRKENFYLSILTNLKRSTNLTKIKENLGISKQQLNYYLRELKKKGFIYSKGFGWYELTEKGKNPTKYGIFLKKDTSRGHAYIWNIELPKEIEGWEKRVDVILKKRMNYKLVGALKTTPRIKALGRKVWLCNNHLRIFDIEKASYYGETAIESRKGAFLELLRIVKVIESKLGFYLRPFKWSFRKEHYALIKNDLAINQNRKGIIMRISDEKGEWLLVDDSLGEGGELETIGKKALQNNLNLQPWWNDHKKHDFKVTPTFILKTMNGIQQNQLMFAKNMESHIKAVNKLGNEVEGLSKVIGKLKKKTWLSKVIKKLKK